MTLTITATAMTMYFQRGYLFTATLSPTLSQGRGSKRWTRFRENACPLRRVLDRSLRKQRGHRPLLHLYGDVGRDFKGHVVVADLGDLAEDAHGDDLVALLQALQDRLVLLGLLHLRADDHEIHDHEHHHDEDDVHRAICAGARACGLGECGADHRGKTPGGRVESTAFSATLRSLRF